MLNLLCNLFLVCNIIQLSGENESKKEKIHAIDQKYLRLNAKITAVDKDSEMYGLISTYVKNTHGETHKNFSLKILEVYISMLVYS
jgi:hypothetical protein